MNSELYFARVYAHATTAIRAWLRDEPPGLVLSIDVGGSFFDRIASDTAQTMGHELVQAPSLVRYRSSVWDYRAPPKPVDVIGEPVLFGRVDGWMQIGDDAGLTKNYSLGASTVATRNIDRWSTGRAEPRLMHFGDPFRILDQIAGAIETLLQARPVLTFYPPDDAERFELLSFLGSIEYRVFNIAGVPVHPNRPEHPLDFGWIAVPAGKDFGDPLDAAELNTDGGDTPSAMFNRHKLTGNAVPRQRRSSEVFGLGEVGPPELCRSIPIADVVVCNDCYPLESDGGIAWRWLGPRTRSRICVPCLFPGTYQFDVMVLSCRMPEGLRSCRVLVEGREVLVSTERPDGGTISFVGYLAPSDYRGYAEIDFVTSGSPPPAGSDPRALRMNLASIGISPCP